MLELVGPTTRLRGSWLDARAEWGAGVHQPGSGLETADDVDTSGGFAAWVQRLRLQTDESAPVVSGRVHATYWWICDTELGRTRRYWITHVIDS